MKTLILLFLSILFYLEMECGKSASEGITENADKDPTLLARFWKAGNAHLSFLHESIFGKSQKVEEEIGVSAQQKSAKKICKVLNEFTEVKVEANAETLKCQLEVTIRHTTNGHTFSTDEEDWEQHIELVQELDYLKIKVRKNWKCRAMKVEVGMNKVGSLESAGDTVFLSHDNQPLITNDYVNLTFSGHAKADLTISTNEIVFYSNGALHDSTLHLKAKESISLNFFALVQNTNLVIDTKKLNAEISTWDVLKNDESTLKIEGEANTANYFMSRSSHVDALKLVSNTVNVNMKFQSVLKIQCQEPNATQSSTIKTTVVEILHMVHSSILYHKGDCDIKERRGERSTSGVYRIDEH